jgi:hypothetical protein
MLEKRNWRIFVSQKLLKEKRLNGIAVKRSLNLFNPKTLFNYIDPK